MTNIIIVGGGTAGWITASILAKGLDKSKFKITLVESPNIPTVGVGEATIPPITQLCSFLDINESEMLKAISGTYKYGIHFEGWSSNQKAYMHAFGPLGTPYGNISFAEMWLNYKEDLSLPAINQFVPSATAAYQGKFAHPQTRPKDAGEHDYYPLTELFYAYQFDASLLAKYLKQYALKNGVTFISDTVQSVIQNTNGEASHIRLNNNPELFADYFVDCSGAKSLLNKQTLNGEFISWKAFLPCDRALAVQTKNIQTPCPYTRSIAMQAGWRWQIPLQNRVGNGYVYASDFYTEEQAYLELDQALHKQHKITDIKSLQFETGYLDRPWNKNCIAIGLSSGFIEPLESTSIHLTHKYALELMNAFRFGENMMQEASMFNQKFKQDMCLIRDFIVMHYFTAKNNHSKFWKYCSNMDIPSSLENRLAEYKQTGYITLPKQSLFTYQSWLQVLVGQGYLSDYKHFSKQPITQGDAREYFKMISHIIKHDVGSLPDYKGIVS